MSTAAQTELNKIRCCLQVAVQQTGMAITTGECVRLATAFQTAMHEDQMCLIWQSTVDRAVQELEQDAT